MKTISVSHLHDHPAEEVWASILSYPALQELASGDVNFGALPNREARAGDDFRLPMKLLGLPLARYRMQVVDRDDHRLRLQTHEGGGPVKTWDHTVEVVPQGRDRCLVTDRVDIEAGLMTPLVAAKARRLYKERARRRALLMARSDIAPRAARA
jgi:ligand-binding SRPBCC domain-containing protein